MVGNVERYNHTECGDTRGRLYVTRTEFGWKYHCHNCAPKFSGFLRDDSTPSPQETIARLSALSTKAESAEVASVQLPSDISYDIPDIALAWLYKYGITDGELDTYGIGWSDSLCRLILPVVDQQGRLIYYQGRGFNIKPKYLNVKQRGVHPLFICGTGEPIVFVEDILSAIKVGRVTTGVALLGSYFHKEAKDYAKTSETLLWLDADKRFSSIHTCKDCRTIGINIKSIYTPLDPKEYSTEEIRKLIIN